MQEEKVVRMWPLPTTCYACFLMLWINEKVHLVVKAGLSQHPELLISWILFGISGALDFKSDFSKCYCQSHIDAHTHTTHNYIWENVL